MTALAVAGLQLVLALIAALIGWLIAGTGMAQSVVAGGSCALAGTLAYAACQRGVPGGSAARLMWGHLLGEMAKIVVTLALLAWVIVSDPAGAPASLAGFGVALLAYPAAIFWLNK
ncbi:MAG: ATP synthase subunit I [Burkholderiales bacterium]|jgi:F0F1-type ATP synthase assembly protein I|nr:ATP synthase subunit I [Burkholderiales bacterium]